MLREADERADEVTDSSGAQVLRAVLELGSAPRSALARHARLSPATVTAHTRALLDAGLLVQLPETTVGGVGRPHVPLALDTRNVVLGLHIAVEQATVSVVDLAGTLIGTRRLPHGGGGPRQVLERAAAEIEHVRDGLPAEVRVLGLGMATGGWVDADAGEVVEHRHLGWRNVAAREYLSVRTGLRTEVDNHTRALLHAEQLFGRMRHSASAIVLFVGNVIDVAFAVAGKVHYGPRAAAGSIRRLSGDGSDSASALFDDYSDAVLADRAVADGIVSAPVLSELLVRAEAAHSPANRLFVERAHGLGQVIAKLVDLLNPDTVIVADRSFELPGVSAAYRDAAQRYRAVPGTADIITGSSFPGRVLAAAASAVSLHATYRAPLSAEPVYSIPTYFNSDEC